MKIAKIRSYVGSDVITRTILCQSADFDLGGNGGLDSVIFYFAEGSYVGECQDEGGPVSIYATRSLIDFSIQEIDMSAPVTPA